MPSANDFRALARSAPWRFRCAHLTWRRAGAGWQVVEAWVVRPGEVRYRLGEGPVEHLREEPPDVVAVPWVGDRQPVLRPDGLVERRPDTPWPHSDDPMVENYLWLSMLDPYELAVGVELTDVREIVHGGRRAWAARAVPTDDYDPRCACCPLLWCEVADRYEADGGGPALSPGTVYPTAYDVVLDHATGIVVAVQPVGESSSEVGFTTEIHAAT